ncbi:unnamed protein product [Schistosoma bovis]|nr:unnamed protein product [Schistosoma bovis]
MFLLTGLSNMNKTSFTERYDKLGLLSNSYSFQWETNSFHTINIKSNNDNKYKSFLLFLYNTTKYKIEKTFNTLQCYHKLIIQKSNYSLDKEINNKSIFIQLNKIDNNNKQYNTYSKENIIESNSYYTSNDNSLKSIDSLYNSGRIINRKHIKYRQWKNKINIKHKKTCINIKINEKSINVNNNNILIFNNDSQSIDSKYSLKNVVNYNKISNIHKQYLFGQIMNDNQWDLFLCLLNTDININSIQKKIKLSNNNYELNKHEIIMIEIYPSVIDLFLRNIPSNLSSSSSSSTNGIYSIILSCLLDHGANIHNINHFYQYTYNGGIQLNTLSYIFEQIAIQLNHSLQIINIINNYQFIDNAGLLRQLLNSGMIPTKLFFLIYTNKLFIFNIKESIILNHNNHNNNNNTNQIYKNHFYPLLIYELVKWKISNQNTTQYLPIILQSFIVLFFNFIYSGLCKLPENLYDIIDNNLINQYNDYHTNNKHNNQYNDKDYIINNQYYLSYFNYYHNKFLQLINKQPFSLFVQCRYKIRNQIDKKYFNKLIMNSDIFNNNNNNHFIINNELYKKLIQLPDPLKHAIGYMEGIHLKNELYTLTQPM